MEKATTKNTPIAEFATITDYGSMMTSALCPFETSYREFTLENGEKYTWVSDKSDALPQGKAKVLLMAWGTKDNTLKRVFVSYKTKTGGMIRTVGMRSADKSLVLKLVA